VPQLRQVVFASESRAWMQKMRIRVLLKLPQVQAEPAGERNSLIFEVKQINF
jgi:hypothetical protein